MYKRQAFKLRDPVVYEGAEGRRRKKTKDPMYTGPIKYIDTSKGDPNTPGFKGGYVIDTEGKKHLAGKVQSIPKSTRPTEPDPEDEETRRQANMRRDLRESGVVKAIEDYLKSRGPSRIRDIADNAQLNGVALNKEPAASKWKDIVGRTKGLVDVIRKFREKFEVYDEAQGSHDQASGL